MPTIPRGTKIIGSAAADLENTWLPRKPLRVFRFHFSHGDECADVRGSLVAIAKWRDMPILDINFRHRAAKWRCNDQIMRNVPIIAALKMCVVVIRKKNGVRKLRSKSPQNHQFVINVGAEQTNSANTRAVLSL